MPIDAKLSTNYLCRFYQHYTERGIGVVKKQSFPCFNNYLEHYNNYLTSTHGARQWRDSVTLTDDDVNIVCHHSPAPLSLRGVTWRKQNNRHISKVPHGTFPPMQCLYRVRLNRLPFSFKRI